MSTRYFSVGKQDSFQINDDLLDANVTTVDRDGMNASSLFVTTSAATRQKPLRQRTGGRRRRVTVTSNEETEATIVRWSRRGAAIILVILPLTAGGRYVVGMQGERRGNLPYHKEFM